MIGKLMYNNDVSSIATHFLCGPQLIKEGMDVYQLASENWAYPIKSFGNPSDEYYAEVWTNGMDYSMNCWVIEKSDLKSPTTYPLLVFDNNEEKDKFEKHDLDNILDACLGYRRLVTWFGVDKKDIIKKCKEFGYLSEMRIWSNILIEQERHFSCPDLIRANFSHASQPEIRFWLNAEKIDYQCLPTEIMLGARADPSMNGEW